MEILKWFQELSASLRIFPKSILMLVIAISPCNSPLTHSRNRTYLLTNLLSRFRFMNQKRTLSKMVVTRVMMKRCQFQMDSVTTTSQTCISKRLQLKLKTRCVSRGQISLDETQSLVGISQVAAEKDRERLIKKCFKDNEKQIKSSQNQVRMKTIKNLSSQLPVTKMRHRK